MQLNWASFRSFFLASSPMPILSRPTLALGSAPGAQIPPGAENWLLATVNASQVVQSRMPDLTLMGTGVTRSKPANVEAKSVLAGHATRHLVLVRLDKRFDPSRLRLSALGYSYQGISILSKSRRNEILSWSTGEPKGTRLKPSNGVMLALVCLKLGAPFVVMSGISFSKPGHAYNDAGRERGHVTDDRLVLEAALGKGLPLYTADSSFSEESGVPLLKLERGGEAQKDRPASHS